jgi:hypothetical protein
LWSNGQIGLPAFLVVPPEASEVFLRHGSELLLLVLLVQVKRVDVWMIRVCLCTQAASGALCNVNPWFCGLAISLQSLLLWARIK